ncbi:MAG: amidohydrolase family protein [Candidatus Lokiarchaeota archaeon]|nr:amidohydrolase family protein [Candidatus Lokiarchaeota archaeon]
MEIKTNMKIIDAHNHLFGKPLFHPDEYRDNLIKVMDQLEIEKTCVSGLGSAFSSVDNQYIKESIEKYPDRIVGAFYIRPGAGSAELVDRAYESGFKMIKVTIPTKPYNDKSLYPIWERTRDYGFPILFHTGIVSVFNNTGNLDINSWYMHPMRIEPIANAFPDLNIIIAHLGVHWNHDAAELARMKNNVYVDLTGEPDGWRMRADAVGMDRFLWWDGAFKKVIFGTDVTYHKTKTILEEDLARYKKLKLDESTLELIFHKNIEKLLSGVK